MATRRPPQRDPVSVLRPQASVSNHWNLRDRLQLRRSVVVVGWRSVSVPHVRWKRASLPRSIGHLPGKRVTGAWVNSSLESSGLCTISTIYGCDSFVVCATVDGWYLFRLKLVGGSWLSEKDRVLITPTLHPPPVPLLHQLTLFTPLIPPQQCWGQHPHYTPLYTLLITSTPIQDMVQPPSHYYINSPSTYP